MRIETSTYRNMHGKQPKGYGLWFFGLTFRSNPDEPFRSAVDTVQFTGNYGDAKRAALKTAKVQGAVAVEVLP